jgi:hypothetical protein
LAVFLNLYRLAIYIIYLRVKYVVTKFRKIGEVSIDIMTILKTIDPIKTGAIFRIHDVSVLRITMPHLALAALKSRSQNQVKISKNLKTTRLLPIDNEVENFKNTR